jgi:hypothetical protein
MVSLATLGALTLPLLADLAGFVSVRAEAGAGAQPSAPGAESEAMVDGVIEPSVSVLSRMPRSTLSLSLNPRIYQREPNFSGVDRPLLLGRGTVAHEYRASRRLLWRSGVTSSYGEVDYNNLSLTVDAPDAGRAIEPVLTAFSLSAESGMRWLASRRDEIAMTGSASRYQPIGDFEASTNPESIGATANAEYTRHTDRRSSLSFAATYSKFWIDPGLDNSTLGAVVAYGRELDRLNRIQAGIGAGIELESDDPEPYPRAVFSYSHLLRQEKDIRISNRFGASWDARLDPTSGKIRRTVGVEAALESSIGNKWTLFLNLGGSFLTSKSDVNQADDSGVLARAGATHRMNSNVSFEFGADFGARLSSVADGDLHTTEERIRGFVAIIIAADFTRNARSQSAR